MNKQKLHILDKDLSSRDDHDKTKQLIKSRKNETKKKETRAGRNIDE